MLRWWVVGLSVLAGSGWLLTQAYPTELGFPFAGCIHFTLIGLSGLLMGMRRGGDRWPLGPLTVVAAMGACAFVLPAAVLELTAGCISSFTSVAMFCAIPVVTVVGAGAVGKRKNDGQLLWPALVGLLGALLLFPIETPGSFRHILCFAAVAGCCVMVGLVNVWMHELLEGLDVPQVVGVVGLVGAIVLGFYGGVLGWPEISGITMAGEAARCAAFDLPFVWLAIWLMREVDPARLSVRYLIAPLATAAEGYAIERGPFDARKIAALIFMAAGAAMLLLKDEAEEATGLGLQ